ncbi:Jacalin-like lectin domain containing protein [Parasponia andersonii]|uniref:Jacalin-like lectin domain containing protein n=1 Tax=Parasponia andersonii TaxID=3476 RepID=A0A2P5BTC9_PARAD|nr:Jacalin-like lectin domain containing protein [Parasponia andersonii]
MSSFCTSLQHPFTDHRALEHPRGLASSSLPFLLCSNMSTYEETGKKPVSVGPWGGQDGIDWDDGVYSTVRQVVIAHGTAMDSIQIEYDKKGSSFWSEKHGGRGGQKTDNVKLDYPHEFLTSIHGCYGKLNEWGPPIVRSLTLISNKKTYGPFGVEQGTSFSFPMSGGKIVGFHGKAGWFLDSIGVHLKPLPRQNDVVQSRTTVHSQNYKVNATSENINGFSVLQGSVGQSYDIVLAVRQRDDNFGSNPLNSKLSRDVSSDSDSSQEFSDVGHKERKKEKKIMPGTEKKVSLKVEGVVTCGPWGGTGGSSFDEGAYTGIKQINVSRNVGIVSIKVLYDRSGESVWGSKIGGTGGFRTDKVIFDYPNEILTHITGAFGPAMKMGPQVIKSLTFHTTKGKHGPFGEEQGGSFSTKVKEGRIVGFHGRKGLFLDAIGVHMLEGRVMAAMVDTPNSKAIVPVGDPHNKLGIAEIDHPQWPNKLVVAKRGPAPEEIACGVMKEPAPCGPGPWGGDGGKAWDDGVYSGIKQIYLTRSPEAICSIQIEYDRNGQPVWSVKHGGNGGNTPHRIKLEYPHEVLICVSGYYGGITRDDEKTKVIRSLTFYTSRGKYGPYGGEIGTYFTSTTTEGKVVGFHGRSSFYLDAIGVHMQHWLGNHRNPKSSLFKFF